MQAKIELQEKKVVHLRIAELFAPYGEVLEQDGPLNEDINSQLFLRRAARNLLRFITFGALVTADSGCNRSLALVENGLTKKDNADLLAAILVETKNLFSNLSIRLTGELQFDNEEHIKLFISCLLSLLPFLNPELGSKIIIPQKINDYWIAEEYEFNQRFDLSPINGMLADILEPKDRMYDYALVPCDALSNAQNHLLLMGTTYPTGQGAEIADLENYCPGKSIGEGHNLREIQAWLMKTPNKKTNIAGHSKGGTMAMIIAAEHPDKIDEAICLNPAALHSNTLKRLQGPWEAMKSFPNPTIKVLTQFGDPLFHIEKGFLHDTQLYLITPKEQSPSSYKPFIPSFIQKIFEAHIQYFIGREDVKVTRLSLESENQRVRREFFDDMKEGANLILYPTKYAEVYASIRIGRKIDLFCEKHPTAGTMIHASGFVLKGIKSLFQIGVMTSALCVTATVSGVKIAAKALFTESYNGKETAKPSLKSLSEEAQSSPHANSKATAHTISSHNLEENNSLAMVSYPVATRPLHSSGAASSSNSVTFFKEQKESVDAVQPASTPIMSTY